MTNKLNRFPRPDTPILSPYLLTSFFTKYPLHNPSYPQFLLLYRRISSFYLDFYPLKCRHMKLQIIYLFCIKNNSKQKKKKKSPIPFPAPVSVSIQPSYMSSQTRFCRPRNTQKSLFFQTYNIQRIDK